MSRMIETYETERDRYARACAGLQKDEWPAVEKIVDTDARKISWSANLKTDLVRNKPYAFESTDIVRTMYRPFQAQWGYFNRRFNERVYQQPRLFPTPRHENVVFAVTGIGASKGFSALVCDAVPNYHMHDSGQTFPLYWYENPEDTRGKRQAEMFTDAARPDADGYIRRDAISDWALGEYRRRYGDETITKEDVFWYVYGILHSPEYKDRFASDLKKMIPRIPFAADFRAFSNAGRELGQWHLGYETVEPYPLTEDYSRLVMEAADWRVHKMVFGKRGGEKDKTVIVFNPHVTLRGVPLEAYDHVVNGKSALEWVMERYAVTIHKESGIRNDPNDWSDDPRYIVDLVKRTTRVSLETVRIVTALPAISEHV